MKALSIKQPYASLIAEGVKDIENRTYPTKFRGTILIHASKTWHDRAKGNDADKVLTCMQYNSIPHEIQAKFVDYGTIVRDELLTSAIIGQVDIVGCVQDSDSIWAEPGAWHWVLKNAVLYEHPLLGIKGALSFWNFDPGKLDKLVIANASSEATYSEVTNIIDNFVKPFTEGRDFMVNQSASEKNIIYTIQNEQ